MNAYDGMEPYVFISYSHRDSNAVVPLIQNLQNRNFRVWYDDGVEVGSIFATGKVFSLTRFTPTQQISALPTKESMSTNASEITVPKSAAISVMAPWYTNSGRAAKIVPTP